MLALLDARSAMASDVLAEVPGWFAVWEQSLSRFRDDSELSMVNRSQGRWISVSPTMWEAVDTALQAAAQSNGLVTPTLLDALKTTGYDRSFELVAEGVVICAATDRAHAAASRCAFLARCRARCQTARPALAARHAPGPGRHGQRLGGRPCAVRLLSKHGPALVDAGGGYRRSAHRLPMERPGRLASPTRASPTRTLRCYWSIAAASPRRAAITGRWLRGGVWQHHILDPRTTSPATTDVLSATIVAPTVREAELAAKVVLILGSHEGVQSIEARQTLPVC